MKRVNAAKAQIESQINDGKGTNKYQICSLKAPEVIVFIFFLLVVVVVDAIVVVVVELWVSPMMSNISCGR